MARCPLELCRKVLGRARKGGPEGGGCRHARNAIMMCGADIGFADARAYVLRESAQQRIPSHTAYDSSEVCAQRRLWCTHRMPSEIQYKKPHF
eukprot:3389463-Rhodomonas_salina.1